MDGISSVSAVLGIASFGLQLYETLKKFINKVAEAPQYLVFLLTDIDLSVSALHGVQELLEREEEVRKHGQGRRLFSDRALIDTWRASDQCMIIFRSVVDFVLKKGKEGAEKVILNDKHPDYLRSNQKVILSSLGRVNWALAQDELERLTGRLTTFKHTLNLVITIVSVKAQNPDLSNAQIIHNSAFRDEVARINSFLKAKNQAQERWVLLQASILHNQSKPSRSSSKSSPPKPPQQEPQKASSSSPNVTSPGTSNPQPLLTLPSTGATVNTSIGLKVPTSPASVPTSSAPNQNDPDSHLESSPNGVLGSFSPLPNINSGSLEPSKDVLLGIRPDQSLVKGSENHGDPSKDTMKPLIQPGIFGSSSVKPNGTLTHAKGPQMDAEDSASQRISNREEKLSEGKPSTGSKEIEKKEEWLSIEAWLYKDSISRELRYSEPQIRDLWKNMSDQSSKQMLETFTSLTEDEHAGVDEAMDSRKPNNTRRLLGIQIHSATGATTFRFFLRLCSLGMLDSDHLETRALIIIIGNKDALVVDGGSPSPRQPVPSPSRPEDMLERQQMLESQAMLEMERSRELESQQMTALRRDLESKAHLLDLSEFERKPASHKRNRDIVLPPPPGPPPLPVLPPPTKSLRPKTSFWLADTAKQGNFSRLIEDSEPNFTRLQGEAIENSLHHEQGQSSKKKGKKRGGPSKGERRAPEASKQGRGELEVQTRERHSFDSIVPFGTALLDDENPRADPDEEQIQKLFAMWTPDQDDIIYQDTEVRTPTMMTYRGERNADLKETDDADLRPRNDVDVLDKHSTASATSLERGRSRSRRSNTAMTSLLQGPTGEHDDPSTLRSQASQNQETESSPKSSSKGIKNRERRQGSRERNTRPKVYR